MPSGIIATIELAEEDEIALAQIPVPIVQLWLHILSFGSDGETQKDVFGFVGEASFKSDLRLLAYEKFPEENADPVDSAITADTLNTVSELIFPPNERPDGKSLKAFITALTRERGKEAGRAWVHQVFPIA